MLGELAGNVVQGGGGGEVHGLQVPVLRGSGDRDLRFGDGWNQSWWGSITDTRQLKW